MGHRWGSAAFLAILTILLTGCAGPDTSSESPEIPSYTAPTYDAELDIWLQEDGWPVPDPNATFDPNAPYMTAQEASALMLTCLQDRGWDFKAENGTTNSGRVPPEQLDAIRHDERECAIENRIGTSPVPPLTTELAAAEYNAQVDTRACLTGLGLEVPQLPSYEVYEEHLLMQERFISIYELASEAGLDLVTDPVYLESCPDPIDTWGHN